jgi:hypothetical protein
VEPLTATSDTCFHSLKYIRECSLPGHEPTGIACRGPCGGRTPPPIRLRRHRGGRAPSQRRMVPLSPPTDPCDGIIGAVYTGSLNRVTYLAPSVCRVEGGRGAQVRVDRQTDGEDPPRFHESRVAACGCATAGNPSDCVHVRHICVEQPSCPSCSSPGRPWAGAGPGPLSRSQAVQPARGRARQSPASPPAPRAGR